MKTIIKQIEKTARQQIQFGIFDGKGREVGMSIETALVVAYEAPRGWDGICRNDLDCGEYVTVRITPTRNGKDYGSTQPKSIHKTQSEADALIAKRIQGSKARYAKHLA